MPVPRSAASAVCELNLARRADFYAPRDEKELQSVSTTVTVPDLVTYTTHINYSSGKREGPVTIQAPRKLADLGPLERIVMAFVCTLYADGEADDEVAVEFTLHALAKWVGWKRPNGADYDRLEQALARVASIRFAHWEGRIEAVSKQTRTGKIKSRWEWVTVHAMFGFADEVDFETREQINARRQAQHLASNSRRTVTVWLNRRFRQAIDDGLVVRLPVSALQKIGLKNRLALQLYFFVLSKVRKDRRAQISAGVVGQIVRPTSSWVRNLRTRTEKACELINSADPRLHVRVDPASGGSWKVVGFLCGETGDAS